MTTPDVPRQFSLVLRAEPGVADPLRASRAGRPTRELSNEPAASGRLQRLILDTLEEARAEDRYLRFDRGWVRSRGTRIVRLAAGVYDLRASCIYLSRQAGRRYCRGNFTEPDFQSSFSRAVRGLVRRAGCWKL